MSDINRIKKPYNWCISAFRFLLGVGVGAYGVDEVIDKYSNGFNILRDEIEEPINNVELVYDIDFAVKNKNLVSYLFAPSYGEGVSAYYLPVELVEGTVKFNGTEIGYIEADEWHNLGVIISLSSSSGIEMDVYFDGIKKIDGFKDSSQKVRSGIGYFSILSIAHTTDEEKEISSRFDGRNEYFVMETCILETTSLR